MDRNEFVVTLLSVGKVAALRDPVNPVVHAAHAAVRDAVAAAIGEGSERMLFEALVGLPQDDLDWLKQFVGVTRMADDETLFAACLTLGGTIVAWAAVLGAEQIFPYQLTHDGARVTIAGGECGELTLALDGTLMAPDSAAPCVVTDLGRLADTILIGRILPGEFDAESALSGTDDLVFQSDASDEAELAPVS